MSQLPEKLSTYTPILGTAKERNIKTFQDFYGPILTADPENLNGDYQPEPRNIDPSVAARFKTRRILEGFTVPEGEKRVAFGADVVFVNGSRHLKSEAVGADLDVEIEETIAWYCTDSFIVHWLIAFAVETDDGLKRIAVLDVEGNYLEPLQEVDVRNAFNQKINARIPLVEVGKEGRANFTLSNSYRDEKVPISQEMAELLVVDRVLPFALLESLIDEQAEPIEGWEVVAVRFLSLLDSKIPSEEQVEQGLDEQTLPAESVSLKNRILTKINDFYTKSKNASLNIKKKVGGYFERAKKYFNLPNLISRL